MMDCPRRPLDSFGNTQSDGAPDPPDKGQVNPIVGRGPDKDQGDDQAGKESPSQKQKPGGSNLLAPPPKTRLEQVNAWIENKNQTALARFLEDWENEDLALCELALEKLLALEASHPAPSAAAVVGSGTRLSRAQQQSWGRAGGDRPAPARPVDDRAKLAQDGRDVALAIRKRLKTWKTSRLQQTFGLSDEVRRFVQDPERQRWLNDVANIAEPGSSGRGDCGREFSASLVIAFLDSVGVVPAAEDTEPARSRRISRQDAQPSTLEATTATGNVAGVLGPSDAAAAGIEVAGEGLGSMPVGTGQMLESIAGLKGHAGRVAEVSAVTNLVGDTLNTLGAVPKLCHYFGLSDDASPAEREFAAREARQASADLTRTALSTTSKSETLLEFARQTMPEFGKDLVQGAGPALNAFMAVRSGCQAVGAHQRKAAVSAVEPQLSAPAMRAISAEASDTAGRKQTRQTVAAVGSTVGAVGSTLIVAGSGPPGWTLAFVGALVALGLGGYKLYRWQKKQQDGENDQLKREEMASVLLLGLAADPKSEFHRQATELVRALGFQPEHLVVDRQPLDGAIKLLLTKFESW